MDQNELNYLKGYAEKLGGDDIGVSVWADETGALHVKAVNAAGGGEPRSVIRSTKFTSRDKAEAFVQDVIKTARAS